MKEKRSRARLSADKRIKEITLIAELIIVKRGFKDITLQEVIGQSSISRGTFFKLIPNKETLLTHLGIKGINYWLELVNKAEAFEGTARERLLVLHAAQVIASKLNNVIYNSIFIANAELNRLAVSAQLNLILDDRVAELIQFNKSCIQQSIQEGNFELSKQGLTIDELAYFMWSNRYGATVSSLNYLPQNNISNLSEKYKIFIDTHMDYMQWKPLSTEIDYDRVLMDIFKKFYKKEITQIKNTDFEGKVPSITEQAF